MPSTQTHSGPATGNDWAARLIPGIVIGVESKFQNTSSPTSADETHTKKYLSLSNSPISGHVSRLSLETKPRRNVLIVGAGSFGRHVAQQIRSHPEQGRSVCGFLDDDDPLGGEVIGRTSNLAAVSRASFVDEIILASTQDRELTLRLLDEAKRLHLDVEMAIDLFGCRPVQFAVGKVGDLSAICLHREPSPITQLAAKRLLDILGAVLGILILGPVSAAVACLIKWDSSGPVIYSAWRIGRKGNPFRCFKFRTMVWNADQIKPSLRNRNERSGPFFKMSDDPRITGVGRWLRRYSLDELPQLWNVLRGEMSLVGPRPHPLDDFDGYGVEHLGRLDVTPGITGLWQVSARRDPSFEKAIQLDREYIEAWSLSLDFRILFRTISAVFRGSGA